MMNWIIFGIIVIFIVLLYSGRKPTKYRIVRSPGNTRWHIEWRKGIFRGKEQHYIGGGLSGYPVYGTTYFRTEDEARDHIYNLIKEKEDTGEIGPWISHK